MMGTPFSMIATTTEEHWRHDTFWTKEPETIAWIQQFKPYGVFYDVGANIGIYSLYAASLYPNMRIYSFEPHASNYTRLVGNVCLNNFTQVRPYMLAVGAQMTDTNFRTSDQTTGSSGGRVGLQIVNEHCYPILQVSLDKFARIVRDAPWYVKIDIDGNDESVLAGMKDMLDLGVVRSILIELSTEGFARESTNALMADHGFILDSLNLMSPHSSDRRRQQGIKVRNIIYTRP